MSRLKHKLKKFFKADQASDSAVELLRMFILPFAKRWDSGAGVDDVLAAFFATTQRKIVEGKALKNFRMPGMYQRPGGSLTRRFGTREVPAGTNMLIVVDRHDQTAKIDLELEGTKITYVLSRPEFEFLKDRVQIYE